MSEALIAVGAVAFIVFWGWLASLGHDLPWPAGGGNPNREDSDG